MDEKGSYANQSITMQEQISAIYPGKLLPASIMQKGEETGNREIRRNI
jgi:hypothetical protein